MRFPLPPDALPPIPVTDKQAHVYLTHVYNLVDEALREYERYEAMGTSLYKQPWKTTARSATSRVVRMKDAVLPTRTHYRIMSRLEADDRQLMEFMYAETTEQFREWQRLALPSVVDARVLAPLMTATAEHPHQCMGIRWVATQPTPWLRNYTTYIEFLSYVQDGNGRNLGVRVAVPVDVPQIAPHMERYRLRRYDHTIIQLFHPQLSDASVPGELPSPVSHQVVNVFTIIQYDHSTPSAAPLQSSNDFDKYLMNVIDTVPTAAMMRRIARSRMLPPSEWVPNDLRQACVVCKRQFSTTRGRHHCRMCGDVICRNCVIQQEAPQYTSGRTFRMSKTKFCVFCMTMLRESPPDTIANVAKRTVVRAQSLDNSLILSHGPAPPYARSDPKPEPSPPSKQVQVRPRRTSSLTASSTNTSKRSDRLVPDPTWMAEPLPQKSPRSRGQRLNLAELMVANDPRNRSQTGPPAYRDDSMDLMALFEIEQRIAKKDRLLQELDNELGSVA